jgi:NADH-quinone oxidoreductase E subunit
MALSFSDNAKRRVAAIVARYPNTQAACLPVLHVAQEEFGYCSDEVVDLVAATLDLPPAHVYGVVTFYTMYHRHHPGTHELMVCTNISCMLRGGYKILQHIEQRLGVKAGETTPDGAFTIKEEECLAACANAPMMICGDDYFLDLDEAKVDQILAELRARPRPQGERS